MRNGSRKSTHKLGLTIVGMMAFILAALLPGAVGFAQTVSFSPATNFVVNTPYVVAIGDLNGDGKPDLATANNISSGVAILLGDGTGSFGSATYFAAGLNPTSVAIGDLNGDGKLDLAVANSNSASVSILLGDGTGSFGVATDFSVGSGPVSIAIGDLNADGKPDLAVANAGGGVSVLLNTGSGSFGTASIFTAGSLPRSVAIGDFNGDSKADLAVANGLSANISIILGDGTGSFGIAANFPVGLFPNSVAIGDLNADGKPDLAVANLDDGSVSILLGTGTGSFGVATNYEVHRPFSVAIKDLNDDGMPDLAVANSANDNVSVFLGTGTGHFGAAMEFAVGTSPTSVAIEDLNGDGMPDLATANFSDNVSILLNTTPLPITGTITGFVLVGSVGLPEVTVKLLDISMMPVSVTATASNGEYTFANLTAGNYSVMIVEPLGYTPDGNPKETILSPGGTNQVDFVLTPVAITNSCRGMGYWKQQFDKYITNKGNAQETQAQLNQYIVRVHQYYTPHFNVFNGLTTFSQWQVVLSAPNHASMLDKARQQLAALVMNFTSLKIGQNVVVTADGRTAGDVLTFVSTLVTGGDASKYEMAKNLAERVCSQQMIAAGVVPAGNVLYKGGGGQQVDWDFEVPTEFVLEQNYPNPFNPSTMISFSLPSRSYVSLRVYDAMGREVATLVSAELSEGNHSLQWNATGLPSGVYFYRISAGSMTGTKKLLLLR